LVIGAVSVSLMLVFWGRCSWDEGAFDGDDGASSGLHESAGVVAAVLREESRQLEAEVSRSEGGVFQSSRLLTKNRNNFLRGVVQ
jgi:hypothetical protein